MPFSLAYADESGKSSQARAFILVTVVFEDYQSAAFEKRLWRWQRSFKSAAASEIKLRRLMERAGYSREKLEIWTTFDRQSASFGGAKLSAPCCCVISASVSRPASTSPRRDWMLGKTP